MHWTVKFIHAILILRAAIAVARVLWDLYLKNMARVSRDTEQEIEQRKAREKVCSDCGAPPTKVVECQHNGRAMGVFDVCEPCSIKYGESDGYKYH